MTIHCSNVKELCVTHKNAIINILKQKIAVNTDKKTSEQNIDIAQTVI